MPVIMYKFSLLLLLVINNEAVEKNDCPTECPLHKCLTGYELVRKDNKSCPVCTKIKGKQTIIYE